MFLWKKYVISKKKNKLRNKLKGMMKEAEELSSKEINRKYKNFSREWALTQGKIMKLEREENEL